MNNLKSGIRTLKTGPINKMNNNNNFEINSEWLKCQSSQEKLFAFLSEIKNLESVLPKDKIQNFQYVDTDKISFEIENIIQLTLYIEQKDARIPYIQYASEPFGKYHLNLKAEFDNNKSKITLSGYLNEFVLSIARKKLTNLVQKINTKLSELHLN